MKRSNPLLYLMLVQAAIAAEWLHGAWDKFTSVDFMNNIGDTLTFFASKNPHAGYADFLHNTAIPNATAFGELVRFGELGIGLVLLLTAISSIMQLKPKLSQDLIVSVTLVLAFILNVNFYYASAWTGPSTSSVNLVMGMVELVLIGYYFFGMSPAPKRSSRKK